MKKNNNLLGIIILSFGVIALLSNLGIVNILNSGLSFLLSLFWPLLFILIGVKRLKQGKSNSILTYIFIVLGILMIMDDLTNKIPFMASVLRFSIPTIIILFGIGLMIKPDMLKHFKFNHFNSVSTNDSGFEYYDFEDDIVQNRQEEYAYTYQKHDEKLFNKNDIHVEKTKRDQNHFNSGEPKKYRRIKNRYTSKSYFLSEDDLVDGDSYLEINTTLGDTRIVVPKTINIKMDGVISIGEIKFISKTYDGLSNHPKAKYTAPNITTKTLHIQANVSIGEIYIQLA